MLINGKIVKDWDKYKIGIAYERPKQHQVISWDMERLQAALVWGGTLRPSLRERVNALVGGKRD